MKRIRKAHWIWGQFIDTDMNYLHCIKSRVNEELKGPNFEIHLTLSGPFTLMDENKINQIEKICKTLKPLEIFTDQYAITNNFFTSFFIEIKKTSFLLNFKNHFLNSNNKQSNKEFLPHISLTYGNFTRKEKDQLKNKLDLLQTKLILNKICIVDVDEDKFSWKIIKTFLLLGS